MRSKKKASSQAAWALITEGVTASRIEAHRLRHLFNRGLEVIENSPEKEHIYQVAGDLIQALPSRLDHLDTFLDRTAYALSIMGEDFLKNRIPLSERTLVQDTVKAAPAFGSQMQKSARRVAVRYWIEKGE